MKTSTLIRRFLPYFKKYRGMLFLDLVCAALTTVCDLVLPGEEPCSLVLDDALTNFDDKRMALALDTLLALGEKRQILLFTCHSREAAYLAGKGHTSLAIG